MDNYLVAGASRGYGFEFANHLRERGERVYEAQRDPSNLEGLNMADSIATWRKCNFLDAQDHLNLAYELVKAEVRLEGVVYAACYREDVAPRFLDVFEVQRHFMANVFGPILTTLYLWQFGVLEEDARVIFLLDRRPLNEEAVAYKASKASIGIVSEHILDVVPPTIQITYAVLPEYSGNSVGRVAEVITNILVEEIDSPRTIDLREKA